jgi:hypothetical protein
LLLHFAPGPSQAQTAMLLLSGIKGVINLHLIDAHCLRISYHLSWLSLKMIEDVLLELGFHLDNSLMAKLKRALFYYTEETQRASLCCKGHIGCMQQVFAASVYQPPPASAPRLPRRAL